MPRFAFLLSLLFGLSAGTVASSGMTLVRDGKAACTIVLASDAGDEEKLAAEELQTYLNKMSGARVPISSDRSVAGNRILLGVFGRSPVDDWKGDPPRIDAFVIETRTRGPAGSDLLLIGGDRRGASYAVYELLERFLNVRWFMPGELGEEVPQQQTIELQNLKWRNEPDYEAIGGLIWHGGPGANDWLRHNKGSVGSATYFFGHSWSGFINPTLENKKLHPQWFALRPDGSRSDQLCTSNPEVIEKFIQDVNTYFDQHPEAVCASISPNDGTGFCTCERCRSIDAQYAVSDGSHTDRFVHFANTILSEVKKKHPDKLIGILAYVSYTRPPVSATPDANYATMVCHTPWDFCHVHPVDTAGCKPNTRFREILEGWTKVCKHVSVYDYYGHYYYMTPWPIAHNIRKDLPYFRRIGVKGFNSETQQHWANQGINFFLAAKLAWDTDRDPDDLLNDFYLRFYGPAAKTMRDYWETWEAAMSKQSCGGGWQRLFTPELLKTQGQLLDKADELAIGSDKVSRRLALHRIGYRFTQAYSKMLQHGKEGEFAQAVAAGEEAVRIVEASVGTEPQAFFVRLASDQTGIQMLSYLKKLKASKPGDTNAAGELSVNSRDDAEMVYVPAGEFLMGSKDSRCSPEESPEHKVYLDGFWIYKTPVTVTQYWKFCQATGHKLPPPQHASTENHPVVNVSWEDATAYAQWAGVKLPTEAQWEKAGRGIDGRMFPWGNTVESVKRRKATLDDEERTKPVGSFPEVNSPYGVQDMVGNVWQWCADWFDENYYRNCPARNPTGPPTGTSRVLRGGRWFINQPNFFPVTFRDSCAPKYFIAFCGFRCVKELPGK